MANRPLTIAVLSGKGGTGKTLVSVNLAAAAGDAVYVDCDVEAPNGRLFFKPDVRAEEVVTTSIPQIDGALCTGCRACVSFCRFHALAFVKDKPMVFPTVCHYCGGCEMVCPSGAIREAQKPLGIVESGTSRNVSVHTGVLNTGEASGVPLIRRLLRLSERENRPLRVIDCPPGSACAVMESISDADYCLLVAEPTIYGAQNLGMVHALVEQFQKPYGVVLNKCGTFDNPSKEYCETHQIPVVGEIAFDTRLGALASAGDVAVWSAPDFETLFLNLLQIVEKEARHETASDPQR